MTLPCHAAASAAKRASLGGGDRQARWCRSARRHGSARPRRAPRGPPSSARAWRTTRSGGSLRMHSRIAVEAVIGSSPRTRPAAGVTAATGSRAKRMIRRPMVAFQKPITYQGSVTANSATRTAIERSEAAGRERDDGEPDQAGDGQSDAEEKQHRSPCGQGGQRGDHESRRGRRVPASRGFACPFGRGYSGGPSSPIRSSGTFIIQASG